MMRSDVFVLFSFIFVVVTNCIVLYFCRISVTIVNVAVQFLNNPLRWESIPADHRLIQIQLGLLHFAVVHGLVITVLFGLSLDQNPQGRSQDFEVRGA